jgi:hypothetical protein
MKKFDKDDPKTWPEGWFRGMFHYPHRVDNQLYGSTHFVFKEFMNLVDMSLEDFDALTHYTQDKM